MSWLQLQIDEFLGSCSQHFLYRLWNTGRLGRCPGPTLSSRCHDIPQTQFFLSVTRTDGSPAAEVKRIAFEAIVYLAARFIGSCERECSARDMPDQTATIRSAIVLKNVRDQTSKAR